MARRILDRTRNAILLTMNKREYLPEREEDRKGYNGTNGSLSSEINELTGLLGVRQLIKSALLDQGSQASRSHPSPRRSQPATLHKYVVVHLVVVQAALKG